MLGVAPDAFDRLTARVLSLLPKTLGNESVGT